MAQISIVTIGNSPNEITQTSHPTTYALLGTATYVEFPTARDGVMHVTVHQQPTGTSPTLDVKLQDSADGANFADISGAAIAQFTGGSQQTTKRVAVPAQIGRYVRCMAAIGGTSTPAYTVTVKLTMKE